ncbi:MAG: hypothetical protein HY482_02110 [Candidatus Wildermuthbacteria bacterium]|nr:hypothetical protein [Candidatus Wildermuthbacteria bacterium]
MKKILFSFAVLSFLFVGAPAHAVTAQEIQAQIQGLLAQIQQLQAQLGELQGVSTAWCYNFTANLKIGDSGEGAKALRTALIKNGFPNLEAMGGAYEFTEQIASAVVGFQEKYKSEILTPNGLTHGTGFVGKSTRAKLNALYGCGANTTPLPAPDSIILDPPSLAVISPNGSQQPGGAEQWVVGKTYDITWKFSGPADKIVQIQLMLPAADGPVLTNVGAGLQRYSWTIPATIAPRNDYRVVIREPYPSYALIDSSDAYFSIVSPQNVQEPITTMPISSLGILSPKAGDAWTVNSRQVVRWEGTDIQDISLISLDEVYGTARYHLAYDTPNDGEQEVSIGSLVEKPGEFQIVITARTASGILEGKSGVFRINPVSQGVGSQAPAPEMAYPADGQVLNYGYPHGYMFKVKQVAGATGYLFRFFQNSEMIYDNQRDGGQLSPNGEFAVWTNNPFYGRFKEGDVEVRAQALVGGQWGQTRVINIKLVRPVSEVPASISVLSPNGGESVNSSPYTISWSSLGIEKVKISVCGDTSSPGSNAPACWALAGAAGAELPSAGQGMDSSGGYYRWDVDFNAPYVPGSVKIRVTDVATGIYDESDAAFSLSAPSAGASPNQ